ncbi:MAG: sensor histidine kinase [Alphaproteobacteria bacterium]
MPSSRRPFRVPVTVLIIALIMALAAPSLTFAGLLLLQSDTINQRQLTNRATQSVKLIADRLDREFRSLSTNLALLASSGWLEKEEYDLLHARATQALAGSDTFLLAIDGANNQILNTRVPWGTPLPSVGSPATVMEAIRNGEPTASNVYTGNVAKQPVFSVTMPIISNESRVKVLMLTRNAATLARVFKDDLPPPGWRYVILDRVGAIVVGDAPPVTAAQLTQLCTNDAVGLHQASSGRAKYSAASETLKPWGWRACVLTSSNQVDAQYSTRWRAFLLITLTIVAVTVLAGSILGQMLAQAIRRAATVGRALDGDGDVPELRSIVREVDDVLGSLTRQARRRKAYEAELKVLQQETAHRAKNQLQIGTALVRLSARSATSVDQLRDDISARLSALGRSIDMMSATPTGEVPLRAFIGEQLEPFAADHPGRLELDGPNEFIPPGTTQSLGLALHELATNAAKYGGWSTPEGRVRIEWSKAAGKLTVVWSEQGGPPPAAAPTRTGFGSSLIEMMVERNLGGSVTRDYRDTGLVCTIILPPVAAALL